LARRAKHLTTTAKLPHAWEYRHDEIAYNYRLPNLNAALGCAQLEQLPAMLAAKRELFLRYKDAFKDVSGLRLVEEPANCVSNYWLQTIELAERDATLRDCLLTATNEQKVMTRPVWTLMSELPHFASEPRMDLSCVEDLAQRLINIPSSPHLVAATS
jgi:perosamine synthetase